MGIIPEKLMEEVNVFFILQPLEDVFAHEHKTLGDGESEVNGLDGYVQ